MARAKKAAVAETAVEAIEAVKETIKKVPAKKKTKEVYLQVFGNEYSVSEITARVEEIWKKEMGRKISELTELNIYVKPEENKAHYVINGDITGSIEL